MIEQSNMISHEYIELAKRTYEAIILLRQNDCPYSISIAGESGCGKTSLSRNLKHLYHLEDIAVDLYHQDDYFHLPPHDNHLARLSDIKLVGPQEVDLELLNKHIAVSKQNDKRITKPLVNYNTNTISTETLDSSQTQVVIVEGTYVSLLSGIDIKIFMSKDYSQTKNARYARARDPLTPFNEKVLAVEHEIIKAHKYKCWIWIDFHDQLSINEAYAHSPETRSDSSSLLI